MLSHKKQSLSELAPGDLLTSLYQLCPESDCPVFVIASEQLCKTQINLTLMNKQTCWHVLVQMVEPQDSIH